MLYFHRKRGSQEKPHRWKTHIGKGKVGVKMNSLFRQGCRDSWANRPGLPGVSFEFMSMSLHSASTVLWVRAQALCLMDEEDVMGLWLWARDLTHLVLKGAHLSNEGQPPTLGSCTDTLLLPASTLMLLCISALVDMAWVSSVFLFRPLLLLGWHLLGNNYIKS